MTPKPSIRIAYADPDVLVRKGITLLLSSYPGVIVCIEADNGSDLLAQIAKAPTRPDICILEVNLPLMNGFDTVTELKNKWPAIGILVLTASNIRMHIMRMVLNGANGYLLKNCDREDLYAAITAIHEIGMHFSKVLTRQFFNAVQNREVRIPSFTAQELQVMKKCCSGLSYAEIAAQLGTTARSVEGHRDSLFRKLNINSRVLLALYAVQLGLVTVEQALIQTG